MAETGPKDIDFSLSEEEKEDLDQMITAFNQDRKSFPAELSDENVVDRLNVIKEHFDQLGDVILKMNKRLDTLYEIIRLMHQKSEIMNKRIDAIAGSSKSRKKR